MRLMQQTLFSDEPTHQICCDEASCMETLESETMTGALLRAIQKGWWTSDERDFCAEHAATTQGIEGRVQ